MESPISSRRTLRGASLSQELTGVVCGARYQLFWGFLRLFVEGSTVFFRGILFDLVSEGVLLS